MKNIYIENDKEIRDICDGKNSAGQAAGRRAGGTQGRADEYQELVSKMDV